jgi:hypothetical protein
VFTPLHRSHGGQRGGRHEHSRPHSRRRATDMSRGSSAARNGHHQQRASSGGHMSVGLSGLPGGGRNSKGQRALRSQSVVSTRRQKGSNSSVQPDATAIDCASCGVEFTMFVQRVGHTLLIAHAVYSTRY